MQAGGPDRNPSDEVYEKLAGLAGGMIRLGSTASGFPGGAGSVDLILGMSGLSQNQAELLASIKRDTRLLREEPFSTARTLLGEASRVGPHDPLFGQHIQGALESFYRAHSLAESARELAMIRFDIALIYLALGRNNDAAHWIRRTQEAARAAINDLVSGPLVPRDPHGIRLLDARPPARKSRRNPGDAIKRETIEGLAGLAAGLLMVPVIFGHTPYWEARRNKASRAAADLVSFTNLVEYLVSSTFNEEMPPPLVLEDFVLREVSPNTSS
jgi:hypothetical protein